MEGSFSKRVQLSVERLISSVIVAFLEIGRRVKQTRRSFPTGQLPYSTTTWK